MYAFQISNIPTQIDPDNAKVEATLTDDSGQPDITRSYSLPTSNSPQPADFEALIQADCDALNQAQQDQETLAQSFVTANVSVSSNVAQVAKFSAMSVAGASQVATPATPPESTLG